MDLNTEFYLQAATITSGVISVGASIAQSFFPSAHGVRRMIIPAKFASGLTYIFKAAQGAGEAVNGAVLYMTAATRSLMRNQSWGEKYRKPITIGAFATALGLSTYLTQDITAGYIFANTSMLLGSAADFFKEGRRLRLLTDTALTSCAVPLAVVSDNPWVLGAELVRTGYYTYAIYKHDFKNAAGPKKEGEKTNIFKRGFKNLQSYCNGVFYNRPTGASIEGQISSDELTKRVRQLKAETPSIDWDQKAAKKKIAGQLFIEKVKSAKPNPHYDPNERMEELTIA